MVLELLNLVVQRFRPKAFSSARQFHFLDFLAFFPVRHSLTEERGGEGLKYCLQIPHFIVGCFRHRG